MRKRQIKRQGIHDKSEKIGRDKRKKTNRRLKKKRKV